MEVLEWSLAVMKIYLLCIILASEYFKFTRFKRFYHCVLDCLALWISPQATHIFRSVFSVPSLPLMPLLKSLFHPFYLEVLCFSPHSAVL